jgi:hypothetical protein
MAGFFGKDILSRYFLKWSFVLGLLLTVGVALSRSVVHQDNAALVPWMVLALIGVLLAVALVGVPCFLFVFRIFPNPFISVGVLLLTLTFTYLLLPKLGSGAAFAWTGLHFVVIPSFSALLAVRCLLFSLRTDQMMLKITSIVCAILPIMILVLTFVDPHWVVRILDIQWPENGKQ